MGHSDGLSEQIKAQIDAEETLARSAQEQSSGPASTSEGASAYSDAILEQQANDLAIARAACDLLMEDQDYIFNDEIVFNDQPKDKDDDSMSKVRERRTQTRHRLPYVGAMQLIE